MRHAPVLGNLVITVKGCKPLTAGLIGDQTIIYLISLSRTSYVTHALKLNKSTYIRILHLQEPMWYLSP